MGQKKEISNSERKKNFEFEMKNEMSMSTSSDIGCDVFESNTLVDSSHYKNSQMKKWTLYQMEINVRKIHRQNFSFFVIAGFASWFLFTYHQISNQILEKV